MGYTPNTTCAGDDEFKDWIKKITFQEIISSAYVDTSDYDSPVHYFLDDIWISLDPSRSIIYPTFMKKVYLNLDDDYFGLFNSKKQEYFYQRSRSEYFTSDINDGPGPNCHLEVSFRMDKEYDIYERQVYSVVGVLQDVGGFYNSLFFAGLLIYSHFQGSIYFSSIISKLYQVEQSMAVSSESEVKRKRSIHKKSPSSSKHERKK
jgi:hypothetical protein